MFQRWHGATIWIGLLCAASSALATPAAAPDQVARHHLATLAAAEQLHTDAALCAALVSADQTQQALGRDLGRKRDALFAQSASDSAALDRLDRSASEAVARLPGVGLSVGAETVYHYVRHAALAAYAPPGSASARVLRLAGDIWRDPSGQPVYFEPSTDISGCQRPSALLPALRELAAAWPAAAACLKSYLRPKLIDSVDELSNGTCYCDAQAESTAALGEIAGLAKVLADGRPASVTPPLRMARVYMCR